MLKSRLVTILNQFPDLPIVVDGYEGGTNPIDESSIDIKYVDKSAGSDWCGLYGDAEDTPNDMVEPELVIYIRR